MGLSGIPFNTVLSIMSQTYQEYCKSVSAMSKDPKKVDQVTKEFARGRRSVFEIALSVQYPAYLVCKMIIDGMYGLKQDKERIKEYSKQPWLIPDDRLREETTHWYNHDVFSSPFIDRLKNVTGQEYEFVMLSKLRARGITFKTEEDLKIEGAEKTPDALVTVPFCVRRAGDIHRTHTVNWIDSKAMFGDEKQHKKNMDQFTSYTSRYGPGMVIYWFGFQDVLADMDDDILVVGDFPRQENLLFI
jgi:CDAN1-interacting nuclease 1|eukprot:g5365.t1